MSIWKPNSKKLHKKKRKFNIGIMTLYLFIWDFQTETFFPLIIMSSSSLLSKTIAIIVSALKSSSSKKGRLNLRGKGLNRDKNVMRILWQKSQEIECHEIGARTRNFSANYTGFFIRLLFGVIGSLISPLDTLENVWRVKLFEPFNDTTRWTNKH